MGTCTCANSRRKKLKKVHMNNDRKESHQQQAFQRSLTEKQNPEKKETIKHSLLSTSSNASNTSSFSEQMIIQEDVRNIYEVGKVIGHGNFSVVRKANQKGKENKQVAIKTIKKDRIQSQFNFLKREISILQNLDHPNIIKVYETYEDEKYYHIVMELCEGGELFERIIRTGKIGEKKAAIIMHKVLSAINHLHENDICHRDIKPENFLFQDNTEDSEIKLIDFGFSRKYGKEEMSTMVGSPFYLAPEILKGHYGSECDIWSCGVLLHAILCGSVPFGGENNTEIFQNIMNGQFSLKGKIWKNISKQAKNFLKQCLTVNTKKRIQIKEALKHQ